MSRVLLVDGENFKGRIRSVFRSEGTLSEPVWNNFNFRGLFDDVLNDLVIDRVIFYFARIKMHAESREKSAQLIERQRLLKTHLERQGFEFVFAGNVQPHSSSDGTSVIFSEKGVDVRIAVDMVAMACDQTVDEIILASSDTDLLPAIREVRKRDIPCIQVGFEIRPQHSFIGNCDRVVHIRNTEVMSHAEIQPTLFNDD